MKNISLSKYEGGNEERSPTPNSFLKKKKITKKTLSLYLFVGVFLAWPLIQFAIFYVYMNIANITMAFKKLNPKDQTYQWLQFSEFFKNFKECFSGADASLIAISFKNNISMFFWTTILGMPMNLGFAYYLYKKKLGHSVIRIIYMLPNMVSSLVMSLLFKRLIDEGLPILMGRSMNILMDGDKAFGIQVFYTLWLGFSTSIILYSNAMFGIDQGMIEASMIDGASEFQQLMRIVIPNIMPTISTFWITGVSGIFVGSGSLFLFYGTQRKPPNETYLLGYYLFRIAQTDATAAFPQAAALSIIITIVTIPLTLVTRWLFDRFDPLRDVYAKEGG